MSWTDLPQNAAFSGGENSENKVPFLKIGAEVTIRVISEPEVYLKHFTHTITGKQTVIRCPGKDSCMVCHREGKPKVRAMFLVYDRTDGAVKLYDAPQTVAAQIKSLMSVWGDLTQYDLLIKKLSSTKRTDYQAIAMPKAPLTQADVDKIKNVVSTFNLKLSVRPHTPEEINAILSEQPMTNKGSTTSYSAGFLKFGDAPNNVPMHNPEPAPSGAASFSFQPAPSVAPTPPVAPTGVTTYNAPIAPAGNPPPPIAPSNVGNAVDAGFFNNFLK